LKELEDVKKNYRTNGMCDIYASLWDLWICYGNSSSIK